MRANKLINISPNSTVDKPNVIYYRTDILQKFRKKRLFLMRGNSVNFVNGYYYLTRQLRSNILQN